MKLDDASFDMTAKDLGLKYNDKADLQELIMRPIRIRNRKSR
ncbi:hypothetical protein [Agathobacter rectalis]|nr:hypothetical protein [Agathobacter rectalis]MCQ4818351.1 hypothetical protein [Agathobacter rectalis]